MNMLRTHVYNDGREGRMELHWITEHCEFLNVADKPKRLILTFQRLVTGLYYFSMFLTCASTLYVCGFILT